jgi:hypothetical protein
METDGAILVSILPGGDRRGTRHSILDLVGTVIMATDMGMDTMDIMDILLEAELEILDRDAMGLWHAVLEADIMCLQCADLCADLFHHLQQVIYRQGELQTRFQEIVLQRM